MKDELGEELMRTTDQVKSDLIRDIRRRFFEVEQERWYDVLEKFSLPSFSIVQLAEMPKSRLRELLANL